MLKNGSFSEGWDDMPPTSFYLINQQPKGWTLRWLEQGESLFGDGATASGIPECVHKLSTQLPQDEQLGGKNALILAGTATYKFFNFGASFGGELAQTVTGLAPGSEATLIVPVQAHLHGETDIYGAESGVWVNGEGEWANGGMMGDRKWYKHKHVFTVPADGTAVILIRVKSKWPSPKDFFIDGITLDAQIGGGEIDPLPTGDVVRVTVPDGYTMKVWHDGKDNTITVTVPPGVKVEQA